MYRGQCGNYENVDGQSLIDKALSWTRIWRGSAAPQAIISARIPPFTRIDGERYIVKRQQIRLITTLALLLALYPSAPGFAASDDDSGSGRAGAGKSGAAKGGYPPEAVKHYNRGVELHQAGFLQQAIEEYRAAIAAAPTMEEAWSNLGGIYAAQRSYSKAQEAFDKALELKPDRPTTLNGLATVLYARGKFEEAKEKWNECLKYDPKFVSGYYNIGNALEGEKKPFAAVGSYAKAVEVKPDMADAFYRIGVIYLKQKHPAQAKVMLDKALLLQPDGDFAKDAKRQLEVIAKDIANDTISEQEVKMNVVTPSASADTGETAAPPSRTAQKVDSSSSSSSDATGGDADHKGGFGAIFNKKKKQKKMDMFVQPATSDSQDLKEKPAE